MGAATRASFEAAGGPTAAFEKAIVSLGRKLEDGKIEMDAARKAVGELSGEFRRSIAITESLATAEEKAKNKLAELEKLHKKGFITSETFARGQKQVAKELAAAKKASGELNLSLSGIMKMAGGAAVALGALAVGGLAAMAYGALKATREVAGIAAESRRTGTSATAFMGMQHAVRALGGDAATVGKALDHFNQVLSGVGAEANFARALLDGYGLSLDALGKSDTVEGLKKVADAFRATADPLQKATLAQTAFGDAAGGMLGVLGEGSEGIQKLVDQALKMGYSMDQIDASKLEKANAELNNMDDMMTGLSRTAATQLSDSFLDAAESIKSIAANLDSVKSVVNNVFRAFKLGWDFVVLGGMGAVGAITIGFVKLFEYITKGLQKVFGLLAKLPDSMGGGMFKGIADSLESTANTTHDVADSMKSDLLREMGDVVKDIDQGFGEVGKSAAKHLDLSKKLDAGGAAKALGRYGGAIKNFASLLQSTQTPLQSMTQKMKEFNLMLASAPAGNTAVLEGYTRGVAKLVDELDKAHGLSEVKLAGGLERGSAASMSAINQAEALQNRKLREKPEDRVARIIQQSQEIEKQQLEYQKQIAEAVRKNPTIMSLR